MMDSYGYLHGLAADTIVRMAPWLVSVGLIIAGIALLIVGGR